MRVEIYAKDGCPFCIKAKELLKQRRLPFVEYKVGAEVSKETLSERAGTPVRTVPQIFIDDKHIGGYTELAAYFAGK